MIQLSYHSVSGTSDSSRWYVLKKDNTIVLSQLLVYKIFAASKIWW